jgi:hypothetical protein
MEKTANDSINDTIIVYVHEDVHNISDSLLVEEVLHRYDRVAHDLKGHDSTPAILSILSLIVLVIGIINRRYKNKK